MPVGGYYGGHGEKVLADMVRRYGAKRGRAIFYATANARGLKPENARARTGGRALRHANKKR